MNQEMICKKLSLYKSPVEIANDLDIRLEEIEPLCSLARDFAPDYPVEHIYQKWLEVNN